jgi:hypothetical protein
MILQNRLKNEFWNWMTCQPSGKEDPISFKQEKHKQLLTYHSGTIVKIFMGDELE